MIPVILVKRLLKLHVKLSKNRVIIIAGAVVVFALLFSALFMVFEGVDFFTALYWAVITMATIGYGDVTPKTVSGRVVAMAAAVVGISTFTALISVLAEFFVSSSLRRMMGMHRVKYSEHYVVIGEGSTVPSCVQELLLAISRGEARPGEIVVVFPKEEEKKKVKLPEEVEVLVGDPTSEDTLRRAGVERASNVILALEDDSKAVFTTLMIKRMSMARVLVEALREESITLLKQAGAEQVIPSRNFAGRLLASSVFEPEVVDVIADITTATGGYDVSVIIDEKAWGRPYLDVLRDLRGRGYTLLGYYLERPVLDPDLDKPIPGGPS
ncbi:ion channel [Thermococcus zilligii]|uniref:ion channel n=1 Tax=Thermococcus zilligii TaxID=54076 RepID=UPI00029B2013